MVSDAMNKLDPAALDAAHEAARECFYSNVEMDGCVEAGIRAHLTAALAQGAGVAVRELKWEEVTAARSNEDPSREHTGDYEAVSPIGVYYIEMYFASDSYGWRVTLHGSDDVADKDDPEAAKAAAQSDFNQRIRSALVASPPEELERVTRERDKARAESDRKTEDWFGFCQQIGVEPDTHEAIAYNLNAERASLESQLAEARAQLAALSREGGE